jgi:hypothetical protein
VPRGTSEWGTMAQFLSSRRNQHHGQQLRSKLCVQYTSEWLRIWIYGLAWFQEAICVELEL